MRGGVIAIKNHGAIRLINFICDMTSGHFPYMTVTVTVFFPVILRSLLTQIEF